MPEPELERRIRFATAYLVRTIRSVTVPGVDPLTWQDWALIYGLVVLVAVVMILLPELASRR